VPLTIDPSQDLLFGLLALQNGLIDQGQLVAAFQTWTRDKGRPMADHLIARGDLEADDRDVVNALVARHLKKHGGDPEQSLAAINAGRSTRESLARLGDVDIKASIAYVGVDATFAQARDDADRTTSFAVGTATTDGQRFHLLRPHARGGLGAVFVALDAELNREVALKQILDRHADDPASRQRFVIEAEVTGGLEHPGIVPVYGLGTYDDGRPYYAMRFIRGDSLKEAIEQFQADESLKNEPGRRALELRKLLRQFLDVCNAIDYAHSRGVLHRDIKPANIIVGKHGETLVVDWGLAKVLGQSDPGSAERTLIPKSSTSGSSETLPGSALGTPAYMSPEQARGDLDHLCPRSDVYSLGATLYCLLTGKAPLQGDDIGAVLRAAQEGRFPPPRKHDRSIDKALEAVCLKAMALSLEDRYSTPRALADELERWMADEPVSAWREPLSTRITRWGRRHRTAASSTGVLLVSAVVGLSIGAIMINRERSKAEANFRQARAAVDEYFTTVSESKLLNVPGLQPLRKELLDAAQKYYRNFLSERGNDRSVRVEAASASFRAGWISQMIGRPGEGLDALRAATALYQQLAADDPGHAEYQRLLAVGHGAEGLLLGGLYRPNEALGAHRKALKIREALVKADPDSVRDRNDLARTHQNIGDIYRNQFGKSNETLAEWEKALAIGRALLAQPLPRGTGRVDLTGRDDLSEIVREDLAQLQLDRSAVLRERGRFADAQEALRQARDLFEALARERPTNQDLRARLGDVYVNGGSLLVDLGRTEEACEPYRRAVEIQEALATANPSVGSYRGALAQTLLTLGWVQRQLGRGTEALEMYRRSMGLAEGVFAENREAASMRNLLAQGLVQAGNFLLKESRTAEALPMMRRALEIQEALARDHPDSISERSALANVLRGVGRAEAASRHPAESRAAFLRASQIDRSLAATYPSTRYNLACSLALMIPVTEPEGREALAVQAIEALRQAMADGYANLALVEKDFDLEALRPRDDFQSLLAEMRAKASAGK
jgi:eukaryotic-like serine/threonine-protein kinase